MGGGIAREIRAAIEAAAYEVGLEGDLFLLQDWQEDLGLSDEAFGRLCEEVESRLGIVLDPEAPQVATVGGLFCHALRRVVEDRRARGERLAA